MAKTVPANAQDYVQTNCHMGECSWSAMTSKIVIETSPNGSLVGATFDECQTTHRGRYPKRYSCRPSEVQRADCIAFCSTKYPSIAFKDAAKWTRTKLSISEDGQFGYNISSITQYLRICHDFVRTGQESLDMVGAKFGYKSRDLGDDTQDTVDSIHKLAE
jgi:hypothetical protein